MKLFSEFNQVEVVLETLTHTVLRAEDSESGHRVLIQALNLFTADPEEVERFRRDYEEMRHLDFEGVATPFRLSESETYIYSTALDRNETLLKDELFTRGVLPLEEALLVVLSLIGVLSELHSARRVVGYLNPSMILYERARSRTRLLSLGMGDSSLLPSLKIDKGAAVELALPYCAPEMVDASFTLDHRADFFSLGALLYQLLAGRPPFIATNVAELKRKIVFEEPLSIEKINPDLPLPVVQIIQRLMQKKEGDRYQSVWGVNADLERCFDQYQSAGKIESFKLAENDVNSTFRVPSALYGREKESKQLSALLQRVGKGGAELCLIRGFSGIGKTELVMSLFQGHPTALFCNSRFDTIQKDRSYMTLINAFRAPIREILSDPEKRSQFQTELIEAVEGNGGMLLSLLPELEELLGDQGNATSLLHPIENQQRLNRLLARFISLFMTPEQPLVLFLDDLQWADHKALTLLESLFSDRSFSYFMFIGAYRDSEIDSAHPLNEWIERLEAKPLSINHFPLAPLSRTEIIAYLKETFGARDKELTPFAHLVEDKTAGNPFFIAEFLKALHQESLVFFDSEQARWCWDLAEIQSKDIPLTLVEFLTDKIARLSPETQQSLMLASCLGNEFDLFTLAMVSTNTLAKTSELLQEAVNEGLLTTLDPHPTYREHRETTPSTESEWGVVAYQFRHHRIRQAISSLIFKDSRPAVHLKVGRLLLENCDDEELLEERIFEIVDHFGLAASLINDPQERILLSELNHRAGIKAQKALAYESAFQHLQQALQFLPKNGWRTHFDLTYTLYVDLIEAAFLTESYDEMDRWVRVVEEHVQTPLKLLPVYETVIHSLNRRVMPQEAMALIHECAELLGFSLPRTAHPLKRRFAYWRYRRAISKREAEEMLKLPPMRDLHRAALIRLVVRYGSSIYLLNPELFALSSFRLVIWQLREGLTPESALSFASLGVYFSGTMKDFDQASFLGELALHLLESPTTPELEARVLMLVSAYILPWVRPVRDALKPIGRSAQMALEIGDYGMALFASAEESYMSYSVGRSLHEIEAEIAHYRSEIEKMGKPIQLHYFSQIEQFLHHLIYPVESPSLLVGTFYDEERERELLTAQEDMNALFTLHHFKLILNYAFGHFDEALSCAEKSRVWLERVTGWYGLVGFYFYEALACCALLDDCTKRARRTALLATVRFNTEQIKTWSTHAPLNHENKLFLLEAELARIRGDEVGAAQSYAESIRLAREQGHLHEQATATERAAQFYYQSGKQRMALDYMEEAIDLMETWGAAPIADYLRTRYSVWSNSSTADA